MIVPANREQQQNRDPCRCPSCGQRLYKKRWNKLQPLSNEYCERGQCLACIGPALNNVIPDNHATYEGLYNNYGQRHGEGTMTWSNGDQYVGNFFNGLRDGLGTITFGTGGEYSGSWSLDKMHGEGTRRFPNGDVYVGEYAEGKRQGQGRFYFANGDLYVGQWENDEMNHYGRYYYSSGQRFEGTFVDGKRHGKGKLQRVDGSMDVHLYRDDQRTGNGVRWSTDRTKAWKLPSKKKIDLVQAVQIVQEIEEQESRVLVSREEEHTGLL
jgi:hypothetical protein